MQEGINHYLAEDYTNSLRACELAILIDANYARAYYGKGLTLRRYNNDQEALLAFERAIELDPTYLKAYYGKGNAHYEKQRYEEALTAYEQTIKLNRITHLHILVKELLSSHYNATQKRLQHMTKP